MSMKLGQYLEYESATVSRWVRNLLINSLPDLWIINRTVRPALARLCGMKCGAGVILQKPIFYGNPKNVQVGSKSAISRGAMLDGFDKITIGDNVAIAFGVTFITSTHELGPKEKRAGKLFGNPIVVGDGCWIAAHAIIGPGTEIGAGSMVSASAVVMQSVPENSLVVGVPGKVITRLESGAGSGRLSEPTAATPATRREEAQSIVPTEARKQESTAAAAKPSGMEPSLDGTMTKVEFYAALESLLEMKQGSIRGTEALSELAHWDSMAVLAFIALVDSKLHEVASPVALAACRTVADLVNLFPGKIK